MQQSIAHIPSLLPLGGLGVVLLQFSIPKLSPQMDLEFLADHPQIINQNCVNAMFKAVEDLRQHKKTTHAFLFYWKAHLLAACVDKGAEKFFESLSSDGGLSKFLSKIELPGWINESPHAAELKELFTKIDDLHDEAIRADVKQQKEKEQQLADSAPTGILSSQITDTGDKVGSVPDANVVPEDSVEKWIYLRSNWSEKFAKLVHSVVESAAEKEKQNKASLEMVLSSEEKVTTMALRLKGATSNILMFQEAFASATAVAREKPLLKDFIPLILSDITPSMLPHMTSWVLNSTEHNHGDSELIAISKRHSEGQGMAYAMSELKSLIYSHLSNPNAIFALFAAQYKSEVDTFALLLRKFRYQTFLHMLFYFTKDL